MKSPNRSLTRVSAALLVAGALASTALALQVNVSTSNIRLSPDGQTFLADYCVQICLDPSDVLDEEGNPIETPDQATVDADVMEHDSLGPNDLVADGLATTFSLASLKAAVKTTGTTQCTDPPFCWGASLATSWVDDEIDDWAPPDEEGDASDPGEFFVYATFTWNGSTTNESGQTTSLALRP